MESFYFILENIGERQMQIFKAFKESQPCSNLTISKKLNLPINCVTGRRLELQKFGLIRKAGEEICPETHRKVCVWAIPNWMREVLL